MPSPPQATSPHLGLIDEVLASIGNAIHDGPVQDIVAAKLIAEVLLPSADRDELGDRTISSLKRASTQSRQLMWALAPPTIRVGHLEQELPGLLAVTDPTRVDVAIDSTTPEHLVVVAVRALHHVVAGSALAGEDFTSVVVRGDAVGVRCKVMVAGSARRADDEMTVWQRLAASRLAQHGGTISVSAVESGTLIRLHLPTDG